MRDRTAVKAALKEHEIELPSWAFGNTGTRFKVFGQPGVPRTPWEKAEDAAQVHRYTGVAPSMAVHIPWDTVDDYAALARHAGDLVLVQARALGAAPGDLAGMRALIRSTQPLRSYSPAGDRAAWASAAARL